MVTSLVLLPLSQKVLHEQEIRWILYQFGVAGNEYFPKNHLKTFKKKNSGIDSLHTLLLKSFTCTTLERLLASSSQTCAYILTL